MAASSKQRFTNRVENYARYRPGYPAEVINLLKEECHLSLKSVIADIGSGTGIFTQLLLDTGGYTVFAVEPNEAMRKVADKQFKNNGHYHSIDGSAEQTTLPDNSVNLIVCAQAFHWFDAARAKTEFKRILKRGGKVALIWNNRQIEADEFSIDYELLLQQHATDYKQVNHQNLTESDFSAFFKNGDYTLIKYNNAQLFDEDGLIGRAFSSSYVPSEHTPEGADFLMRLKNVFNKHQVNNQVSMEYQTEVYLGEV